MSRGRSGRAGPGALAREALANVRAWGALSVVIVLVAAGLGAYVTWSSADVAQRSMVEAGELDEAGRQVLRLVPDEGLLPAAACEALRANDAIAAAYGVGQVTQARLASGALVTVQDATDGVWDYLSLVQPGSTDLWVISGASVSEREGLVDAGWLAFGDGGPPSTAGQLVQTTVLDAGPRTGNLDDSIVVTLSTTGLAAECRVEPVDGARDELVAGLAASVGGAATVRTLPLREDLEAVDEPERLLRAVPGNLATLGAGGIVGLLVLAWWFVRRAEWALYRTFGVGTAGVAAVALAEWVAVCGLPLVVGGLWGIALTEPGSVDLAYELAGLNLAIAGLVALAAVGLWCAYSRVASSALALRGM